MSDNLIGYKFGKLTVIAQSNNTKTGKRKWICMCECGKLKEKPVVGYDLKSGKVQSCGCNYKISNKHRNKRHGDTNTRLYHIWCGMKARCNNKNNIEYMNYGGRGITYATEWKEYENFRDWALLNGYENNLTLDRVDVNGDYCPDNCRWATMKQQQNNKRNTIYLEVNGAKLSVTEWAEKTGIAASTLTWRLKHEWNENEMFLPVSLNNKNIRSGKYE